MFFQELHQRPLLQASSGSRAEASQHTLPCFLFPSHHTSLLQPLDQSFVRPESSALLPPQRLIKGPALSSGCEQKNVNTNFLEVVGSHLWTRMEKMSRGLLEGNEDEAKVGHHLPKNYHHKYLRLQGRTPSRFLPVQPGLLFFATGHILKAAQKAPSEKCLLFEGENLCLLLKTM